MHFIDTYSRFTWINLLRNKSGAFQTFLNFQAQAELQLGHKLKAIQSDWGDEYWVFSDYLKTCGIVHKVSCPHTHAQNMVVERKHRHIVETRLTLLDKVLMLLKYWDEIFKTTVCIINKLPTSILNNKTLLKTPI